MINSHEINYNKNKFIREIIGSREFKQYQRKAKTNFETLKGFFEQFTKSFPEDYLHFLSVKDYLQFIIDRFKFISSLKDSGNLEDKIKISVQTNPRDPWLVNAHIIEIMFKDMPFVKNSILELLQQDGYQIRYFITNIFDMGLLQKVRSQKNNTSNELPLGENYFYTYIIIEKRESFDPEILTEKIRDLLFHINYVTSDFQPMGDAITNIQLEPKLQKFFQWINHNNFILFSLSDSNRKLGLFKDKSYSSKIKSYTGKNKSDSFHVIKTEMVSRINRKENILIIQYKTLILTGIFTRKADNTSSFSIPLLSDKLSTLIHMKHAEWTALDVRDFIFAFDLLPLVYRFIIPIEGYLDFSELLYQARITIEAKVRLRTFKKHHYFLLLIWPVSDLTDEFQKRFKKFLAKRQLNIRGEVDRVLSTVVYLLYELEFEEGTGLGPSLNVNEFESELREELISWDKKLKLKAEKKFKFEKYIKYKKFIQAMIDSDYRDRHHTDEALLDLEYLHQAFSHERLFKGEYLIEKDRSYVKIFSKEIFSLSYFVPLFSNMDLKVISDESYEFILPEGMLYYYKFDLQYKDEAIKDTNILDRICETVDCIINQVASSEPLNSLILNTNLSIYQIELLKALVSYLIQVKKGYSRVLLKKVLQSNPDLSCAIIYLFELKFLELINSSGELLKKSRDSIKKKIKIYPDEKSKIPEFTRFLLDKINNLQIKNIIQNELYLTLKIIIKSIVRTNYFTEDDNISFKIFSSDIDFIPQPSPLYEIWVYHPHFEGVHLRGGVISRGGIRWSDRQDDFRTEIWGLWKTQVLKNTIIVPTGAKGGFVLKYLANSRENAVSMYKKFMDALIRLTDNRRNNINIKNDEIPAFDESDNYLVVAADKGTASFSDYANEISITRKYWLDDAFASGGKNGYSHKALGITALGAWESGKWHLHRIGKDPKRDEISMVGIGDMSGDVFGNGLIFSNKLKLIGAFNHKYIFIDPQPEPAVSFSERVRLFKETADWDKYNRSLISKGGGVFERESIDIKLSSQVQEVIATNRESVTGEELIRLLLKAPVDILFNGGIGTYIKSSEESNHEIDDLSNDSVRVDATEVRSKIIVEGGNLGVSNAGRIEYSFKGGLINTDAIDNSAGVDLSDHEVNLKILFKIFMVHGLIKSNEERNKRLKKHAHELVKLVLQNNFRQNWALIYLQSLPPEETEYVLDLLEMLAEKKLWMNTQENSRDRQLILKCVQEKTPIPSPLLAYIHSLTKIYLEMNFEVTQIKDIYNGELQKYFPESIATFKDLFIKHPLKNDIIKMMLVNKVIDLMGFPGLVKCKKYLGLDVAQMINNFMKVLTVLKIDNFRFNRYLPNIEKRKIPVDIPLDLTLAVKYRKEEAIYNFMELIVLFGVDVNDNKNISNLPKLHEEFYSDEFENSIKPGLNKEELRDLFQLAHIDLRFALRLISDKKDHEFREVANVYFFMGMQELKQHLYMIRPHNQWEIQSHMTLKKAFWNGLVHSNLRSLIKQIEKINLANEIKTLKESGNLNLSAFTGILAFLFP